MTKRTWAEVARGWREDPDFRAAFSEALADEPHQAFAWETVPVSAETRDRPFEQVVLESPGLAAARADPAPFAGHFGRARDGVATFRNLGGDALLVAPAPAAREARYAHLAAFLRTAPAAQIHALWIAVGRAVEQHWEERASPIWVSTAGLGVHWLHVRLDDRPKYYRHAPFRVFP